MYKILLSICVHTWPTPTTRKKCAHFDWLVCDSVHCAECVCVFDVFFCIPFCVTLLLSVCLRVPDICNKWILWLNKEQNITVHFIRRIVLVCLCYSTSSNIGGLCLTQPHKQRVETLNWYGMAWHDVTKHFGTTHFYLVFNAVRHRNIEHIWPKNEVVRQITWISE